MKSSVVTQKELKDALKVTEDSLKKSMSELEDRLTKAIKDSFVDFYESILLPHMERNDKEHDEIRPEIIGIKQVLGEVRKDVGDIKEYIKDHESRLEKVEAIASIKN